MPVVRGIDTLTPFWSSSTAIVVSDVLQVVVAVKASLSDIDLGWGIGICMNMHVLYVTRDITYSRKSKIQIGKYASLPKCQS